MTDTGQPTRALLGEPVVGAKLDRDLMLARLEQRLLGRALEPVRVGRFVVLRRVGQGGMGIVYAAHDPELDRKVAVKIVDHGLGGGSSTEAHRELLREARAAAALTHPNVVTVYEVGTEGDAVFLAMEYVDGPTLRQWLAAAQRGWREVVRMFAAAGRGLAAAHRAGLVHRDFKPDNVLIGDDGRPRVADFGLARLVQQARTDPGDGEVPAGEGTFTAVAGTPSYMAPEQHEGRAIGPASDQFAFCVALWEALVGRHPFGEGTAAVRVARVLQGELEPPGAGARAIPPRVLRLLTKGLQRSPSQRHADMDLLLGGLEAALLRRRRVLLGGGALGLAGLAALAGYQVAPAPALDPCADAASPLGEVWSPEARAALEAAFVATAEPGAETTAARVVDKLERYAADWSAMRERTCRATLEEGQRSELLMELGYACLERRLRGMSTLVERFAAADAETLSRAAEAVDDLLPLAACEDRSDLMALRANALRDRSDPSARPGGHDELHALFGRLAEAEALSTLGRRDEALAIAEAVIGEASAADLRSAEAAGLSLRGRLRRQESQLDAAAEDLRRAAALALEADRADVAIAALVGLADVLRRRREGLEHAPLLLDLARGLVRRGPAAPADALRVELEQARLDRLEGRLQAVRDGLRPALAEAEAALGPDHTLVLAARNELAANLDALGELEEAERIFADLLPRRIALYGPRHRSVGTLLLNLGVVATNQKRWDVAERRYTEALAFYEERGDALKVEQVRFRQGVMWRDRGHLPEAAALFGRVLEDRQRRQGPDHADLAEVLEALADVERRQGRHDQALARLHRALALLERAHGPQHLGLRTPLVTLGKLELDRGRPAEAETVLRRAHGLVFGTESSEVVRGEVCFDLARAIVGDAGKQAEALALARQAQELLTAAGEAGAPLLRELEAWLRAHAEPLREPDGGGPRAR